MTTPAKEWWKDLQSTKPGPARIRVTLSRDLTPAEQEHLRQVGSQIFEATGDKFRLGGDGRLYLESTGAASRKLFDAASAVLAYSFVNVFPTAVRTFRELVTAPRRPAAGLMKTVENTHDGIKVGEISIPVVAVANKKRTKVKKAKVKS